MILFSDRGTPDAYHKMHGYSGHTHKWIKSDGSFVYTQVHLRADGGFKTLNNAQAGELAGANPDYGTEELFNTIESGNFPSWTVYVVRLWLLSLSRYKQAYWVTIANDDPGTSRKVQIQRFGFDQGLAPWRVPSAPLWKACFGQERSELLR